MSATPTALLVTRQVVGECSPRRREDGVVYCDTHSLRAAGPPSGESVPDGLVGWELPAPGWACGTVLRHAEFLSKALGLASSVQVAAVRRERAAGG